MPMTFEGYAVIQEDRELSRFYRQNNELEPFSCVILEKCALSAPLFCVPYKVNRVKDKMWKEEHPVNADQNVSVRTA